METTIHPGKKTAYLSLSARVVALLILSLLLSGCRTPPPQANTRPFAFETDTFAYANDLVWEYDFTPDGKWKAQRREPKPDYTHHCFVVARCAKQFFHHARFEPAQPKTSDSVYQKLIREVIDRNPRLTSSEQEKVVIPGFANLRDFSAAHATSLKQYSGGAWRSYFQRGNWRIVFPFSRKNQAVTADTLVKRTKQNVAPVVHLVQFPELAINHGVVLFEAKEKETQIDFLAYDPNKPDKPVTLTFFRDTRTFHFPRNDYFIGGPVDVYEVYKSPLY